MNIYELKQIILNMGSAYRLIDLINSVSDEPLDKELEDTLLDVSVAIMMTVCRSDISVLKIMFDEQLEPIVHRARVEIERQGLDFAQFVKHKPNNIYAGVKCGK